MTRDPLVEAQRKVNYSNSNAPSLTHWTHLLGAIPLGQGASEKSGTTPTSTYTVLVFAGNNTMPGMLMGVSIIFLATAHVVAEQK